MNKRPLRVAIIGTAKRSDYLYGPLIKALPGIFLPIPRKKLAVIFRP